MKIVEKFTDLDKANAYVADLNSAYGVQVEEAKSHADKLKLAVKDLSRSQTEHENAVGEKQALNNQMLKREDEFTVFANKYKVMETDLAESKKAHEKALAEVGELSSKLDLQEKHGGKGGTIVSINKKSYQLSGNRFITQSGEKTADEVSKDKDFLKHLLEIGSGALVALD